MEIILSPRGGGKTYGLIKKAHKEQLYILCSSMEEANLIVQTANMLKVSIPHPLTPRDLPLQGMQNIDTVLVDNADRVLETLIGRPITALTLRED